MYKYLILFHDIAGDYYRAYVTCDKISTADTYINRYCRINDEAIIIDTYAGTIDRIVRRKPEGYHQINFYSTDHFVCIEQIGLNWDTMKTLARRNRYATTRKRAVV